MNLFTVDEEKCKRDGICVAECPMRIIELKDAESTPTPTRDAEELCINCGHCVAVCPHGALSLTTMPIEACPPVKKEWLLDEQQAEHFLRYRRSIRIYKDEPVDRSVIQKLIDTARFAPSGHNAQPVHWLVIYDSREVQELAGLCIDWMRFVIKEQPAFAKMLHMDRVVSRWEQGSDPICRSAPHVIVAHAEEQNRTAPTACTIALTYLELAIPSFGLGGCWAGFLNTAASLWPPMQEALALPEGHSSMGAMMIGIPKFKYHRLPLRNEARVTWR